MRDNIQAFVHELNLLCNKYSLYITDLDFYETLEIQDGTKNIRTITWNDDEKKYIYNNRKD